MFFNESFYNVLLLMLDLGYFLYVFGQAVSNPEYFVTIDANEEGDCITALYNLNGKQSIVTYGHYVHDNYTFPRDVQS